MLAHSGNFKHISDYGLQIRSLVEQLVLDSRKLAVSYHPREKQDDWLNLVSLGASLIPHAVPAELIYLFNRHNLRAVYGDIGTSLITARWLLPDVAGPLRL